MTLSTEQAAAIVLPRSPVVIAYCASCGVMTLVMTCSAAAARCFACFMTCHKASNCRLIGGRQSIRKPQTLSRSHELPP
jgi:hypothetical protein